MFESTSLSTLRSTPGMDISPARPRWPEPRITTEAPTSPHRKRSLRARSAVSDGCGMRCSSLSQTAHDLLPHKGRYALHDPRTLALLYRVAWRSQSPCQD